MINWQQTLHIPSDACLSPDTQHLIQSLCCSASQRLGRPPGGAAQLKAHPFFTGVQFDNLRHQRAPYVPRLRYATDTSNFDTTADHDERPITSSNTGGSGLACDGARHAFPFLEFTFRRFFDADGHAHATRLKDGPDPVYV